MSTLSPIALRAASLTAGQLRPPTIALMGDSITWFGTEYDLVSGTLKQYHCRGPITWANAFLAPSRQQLQILGNFATPGWSMGSIFGSLTAVLASNPLPGYVLVHAGINDIISDLNYADMCYAWGQIMRGLEGAGIRAIATTLMALGPSMRNTTSKTTKFYDFNNYVRSECAANGWVLCDWYAVTADPTTGYPLPNTYADDTHPESPAAFRAGAVLADTLAALVAPGGTPLSAPNDPSNLVLAGGFVGTGGSLGTGVTGDLALGWTALCAGAGTVTASKVPRLDPVPGEWQQIVVNPLAAADYVTVVQIIGPGWAIGDTIRAAIEFEMDAGHAGILACELSVACYSAGYAATLGQVLGLSGVGTAVPLPGVAWRGVAVSHDLVIPASTAIVHLSAMLVGQTGGHATARMARPSLRVVH